jgi:hypothetical protein
MVAGSNPVIPTKGSQFGCFFLFLPSKWPQTGQKLTVRFLLYLLFLLPIGAFAQDEPTFEAEPLEEIEIPQVNLEDAEAELAETTEPYVVPPPKPVAMRDVDDEKWREAAQNLDYSKDLPKPPKARKPRTQGPGFDPIDWTSATQGLGSLLQVLAILAAVAGIAYGIYRMMQAPQNRRIARDGVEITLGNLDDYIHETDLERFLREAVAAGDFPLAVRIYYLQIIKSLSERGSILWSKEKTNRDYLREMREHRLGQPFREATRDYERVWYGNQHLSASGFARLEPAFKSLLGQI